MPTEPKPVRAVAPLSSRNLRPTAIFLASALLSGCGDGSEVPSVAPPPSQEVLAASRPGSRPEKKADHRRPVFSQPRPPPLKTARP
jgi:hypothetical protein